MLPPHTLDATPLRKGNVPLAAFSPPTLRQPGLALGNSIPGRFRQRIGTKRHDCDRLATADYRLTRCQIASITLTLPSSAMTSERPT